MSVYQKSFVDDDSFVNKVSSWSLKPLLLGVVQWVWSKLYYVTKDSFIRLGLMRPDFSYLDKLAEEAEIKAIAKAKAKGKKNNIT